MTFSPFTPFRARRGAAVRLAAAALTLVVLLPAAPRSAHAQAAVATAPDPTARLRQVLPAAVADRVLARIAAARAHDLPAVALEQRALKFAARGVAPDDIERSVGEQADRMDVAKQALESARGGAHAPGDEIEAGAEAIRQGVDGAAVSALARSAPSGRSLAVPLYVIGSLTARGLPSDEALARVRDRLAARASDAELEQLPVQAAAAAAAATAGAGRPSVVGRDLAATKRSGAGTSAGGGVGNGPPPGVPANGGAATKPNHPGAGKGKPGGKKP
ncbi:MAG TPA: hypothetical protein VFJ74_12345 [Gemmatimonadaceae bacterium]|nr:hypothetical protein [Gemmatimonadaceae bacterium]